MSTYDKVYYGVLISRRDKSTFLASGGKGAPVALFYHRKDATQFKRELDLHGCHGKVVPIKATFDLNAPTRRKQQPARN